MDSFSIGSVCLIIVLITKHGVNADLLEECADDAACRVTGGDTNAVCSMDTNAGGDADGNCICTGAYKNNGNNDGCVAKGLSDTCNADSDCAGVTNAECTGGQCACAAGYKGDGTNCVKVLDVSCNDDADCSAQVPNSECSSSTCSCITNYKDENSICVKDCTAANECTGTDANSDCTATSCSCIAGYKLESGVCTKVLTGSCTIDLDCSKTVAHSTCSSSKCECTDGFKENNNECLKVLTESCTTNADCTGTVPNSECSSTTCSCVAGYKEENNLCAKMSVLETPCSSGDTDCTADNSECDDAESTPKCKCSNGYKQGTADNTVCKAVLGTSCTKATDCTSHVQNSECIAAGVCSCVNNYIKDGNVCAKELGQTCSSGECVTNAECDETCKCSDGYIDTNGLCAVPSSTITAKLSTSVTVMSILSIAVRNIL